MRRGKSRPRRRRYEPLFWLVAALAAFLLARLVCAVLDALAALGEL